jgi:hypothetical protein
MAPTLDLPPAAPPPQRSRAQVQSLMHLSYEEGMKQGLADGKKYVEEQKASARDSGGSYNVLRIFSK